MSSLDAGRPPLVAGAGGENEGTNSGRRLQRVRRRFTHRAAVELGRHISAETLDLPLRQRMIGATIARLVVEVGFDDLDDTAGQIAEMAGFASSGSARDAVKAVWDRLEDVGLVRKERRPPKVYADGTRERGTPMRHVFVFPQSDSFTGAVYYTHKSSAPDMGHLGETSAPESAGQVPQNPQSSAPHVGDTRSSSIDTHRRGDIHETGIVGGGHYVLAGFDPPDVAAEAEAAIDDDAMRDLEAAGGGVP